VVRTLCGRSRDLYCYVARSKKEADDSEGEKLEGEESAKGVENGTEVPAEGSD
jgi:hypothetical protein